MAKYFTADFSSSGTLDSKGNLKVYTNADAINSSIKNWIASFRSEKLRLPNKGGCVINALFQPLSEDTAAQLSMALSEGLRTDFNPPIKATSIEVIPDYDHDCYQMFVVGYCPSLRTQIQFEDKVNRL